jgi:antirestriction protein ArdC
MVSNTRRESRNYAAEELIAGLGAPLSVQSLALTAISGIGHWIELLKIDKQAFFTACSQTSKAPDYLRGLALAAPIEAAA